MVFEKLGQIVRGIAWRYTRTRPFLVRGIFAKKPEISEVESLNEDSIRFEIDGNDEYTTNIFVISNRKMIANRVRRHIGIKEIRIVDGKKASSFSSLCNSILMQHKNDINIIISDKCFPDKNEIGKLANLISSGIGIVGIYRFGCFGVHPKFLSSVGFFDENFTGGGFEDGDLVLRSIEAGVSIRLYEAIKYFPLSSSWNSEFAKTYFHTKWIFDPEGKIAPKRNIHSEKAIGPQTTKTGDNGLKNSSYTRLGKGSAGAGLDKYL